MAKADKFNFCIGFEWPNSGGVVGLNALGSNHWFGTMEDAEETLEFIRDMGPKRERSKYAIYRLVRVCPEGTVE